MLDVNQKVCCLERLTRLLTATACPPLAGKPKLFIMPASLGNRDMAGFPEPQQRAINSTTELSGEGKVF